MNVKFQCPEESEGTLCKEPKDPQPKLLNASGPKNPPIRILHSYNTFIDGGIPSAFKNNPFSRSMALAASTAFCMSPVFDMLRS